MNRMMTATSRLVTRSSAFTAAALPRFARSVGGFSRPAPPALNRKEQKEFEDLVKSYVAPASLPQKELVIDEDEETMHPQFRQKPRAKFEGETNPETGEVGGPKHEPLAHGKLSPHRLFPPIP